MTEQLEHDLRQLFAEDADRAPLATDLAGRARRRVARRRRRVRVAWGAGALAAASVAAFGVYVDSQNDVRLMPEVIQRLQPPVIEGEGPLDDGANASCVEDYSPAAVAERSFAFDGTVTEIGPGTTDRPGVELGLAAVTFKVNEWFVGGSEATVTVDMTPPDAAVQTADAEPAYGVGTRLLVTGEPRWGGAPLEDAIAWGCDFSRYHDEATADRWRAAFE
jgi:hypothetical protein